MPAGLAVVLVVVIMAWAMSGGSARASFDGQTGVVEKGPLVVRMIESGEMEAEHRDVIANEVRWPAFIKSIAPEGTIVQEGDLIVEFECKELIDAISQQQITVTSANNDYRQARETTALTKKVTDYNVYKAQQALNEAKENLRRYEEGDWPVKQSDAESTIQMAKRDLTLAQGKLNFKLKANEDPELKMPYSPSEIEADKLGVDRLKLAHERAISQRDMLVKYDYPQDLRKYQLAIKDAELSLDRSQVDARTQMLTVETNEQSKKVSRDNQQTKLDDLLTEQKSLVRKASRAGLVVYDVGAGRRFSGNQLVVEVSAKIDPHQQIMIIPEMSSLLVKTRVYEALIDQVQKGAEAYVRLDARPDRILSGRVEKVAVLPDNQNWLNPTIKLYNVYIRLDEQPEGLKPGMTSQVEIILARLGEVLNAPVAAVFSEQDDRYCFRVVNGQCERRQIRIGRTSDTRVEVLDGLASGDQVLLAPPANLMQDKPSDKTTKTPAASRPALGSKATTSSRPTTSSAPASDRAAGTRPTTAGTGPSKSPASSDRSRTDRLPNGERIPGDKPSSGSRSRSSGKP